MKKIDKILNFETNRYVKRNGKIGKLILKKENNKKENNKIGGIEFRDIIEDKDITNIVRNNINLIDEVALYNALNKKIFIRIIDHKINDKIPKIFKSFWNLDKGYSSLLMKKDISFLGELNHIKYIITFGEILNVKLRQKNPGIMIINIVIKEGNSYKRVLINLLLKKVEGYIYVYNGDDIDNNFNIIIEIINYIFKMVLIFNKSKEIVNYVEKIREIGDNNLKILNWFKIFKSNANINEKVLDIIPNYNKSDRNYKIKFDLNNKKCIATAYFYYSKINDKFESFKLALKIKLSDANAEIIDSDINGFIFFKDRVYDLSEYWELAYNTFISYFKNLSILEKQKIVKSYYVNISDIECNKLFDNLDIDKEIIFIRE